MAEKYDAETATFMGVARKEIPWWPTIDYEKCNYCMDCDKFCPHKVFEKKENEQKKLVVKNPYNCVVFCRACMKLCGPDALIFQDKKEVTALIKEIRKKNQ
ncbi:MAG: ferredoxin family protein [Candidatus Heimdallarchaeota archaeon]|nr:ferredoxin family protein [Candidatus Heimdallarchaeota archaeon]MBY8995094.1 ferredoxin family protein [Candidatus Heimdallarchaeota archaeon]